MARVSACTGVLVFVVACGTSHADRATSTMPPAANHAARAADSTQVLGRQLTRNTTIAVTSYEQRAFLELTLTPAVSAPERHPVLERWVRNPRVHLSGDPTPEDLQRVAEATQSWSLITGLTITATPGPAEIEVHFVPRADFAHVLGTDHLDPTAVGLTRVTIDPKHPGVITGGIVAIADDDLQVGRNRTIDHELGHAIGLQHSSCASSLMDGSSDAARSVRWTPSALDIRVGGLLYDPRLAAGFDAREVTRVLTPTAPVGVICGPVDLELVRAAGSDRHYLCARSLQTVRPCTADLSHEPKLPIVNPDAWTDGHTLSSRPRR